MKIIGGMARKLKTLHEQIEAEKQAEKAGKEKRPASESDLHHTEDQGLDYDKEL
ncbi:hypothetical protein [Coralliovum pocilloporae]|uniref:hypothetical protein n=1 Tax=Coralliovum pocilloporae TaxID=3066369 RepID=UPI0033079CF9